MVFEMIVYLNCYEIVCYDSYLLRCVERYCDDWHVLMLDRRDGLMKKKEDTCLNYSD